MVDFNSDQLFSFSPSTSASSSILRLLVCTLHPPGISSPCALPLQSSFSSLFVSLPLFIPHFLSMQPILLKMPLNWAEQMSPSSNSPIRNCPTLAALSIATNVMYRLRTTFPDSTTNTVGMFYNGRTSRVDIAFSNKESKPIMVQFIGGAFQDIATLKPVHNVLPHYNLCLFSLLRKLITLLFLLALNKFCRIVFKLISPVQESFISPS
jgi:hypothetical protein